MIAISQGTRRGAQSSGRSREEVTMAPSAACFRRTGGAPGALSGRVDAARLTVWQLASDCQSLTAQAPSPVKTRRRSSSTVAQAAGLKETRHVIRR